MTPTTLTQALRIIAELKAALDARQAVVGEKSLRIAQLEVKCDLLAASLRQADETIAALTRELEKEVK